MERIRAKTARRKWGVGGVPRVSEWALGALGFEADEVQRAVLDCEAEQVIVCCTRQWGKTDVGAIRALHTAVFVPGARVVVVAPGGRQGAFVLEAVEPRLRKLGLSWRIGGRHRASVRLENGSDIVAVPDVARTVRGFRRVSLMIFDEAAQVSDETIAAAAPALMAVRGKMWLLSTPFGQTGLFYEAWAHGGADWARFQVKATECARIPADFLARYERTFGTAEMRQEYLCEFLPAGGQVIDRGLVEGVVSEEARPMRAPFAAAAGATPEVMWFVGLDLGMRRDPTAMVALKREVRLTGQRDPYTLNPAVETVMTVEKAERVALNTPYSEMGSIVKGFLGTLQPEGTRKVIADATGGGDAVVAQLKASRLGGQVEGVVITGGNEGRKLGHAESVPRRALLENLRRMLELKLFTMAPGLKLREDLTREVTSLGVADYRGHDDLAFALALAAWGARPKAWVGEVGQVLDVPILPEVGWARRERGRKGAWWVEGERRG